MRTIIEKILNDYITAKQETFAGHRMGMFFRNDIPNIIYKTGIVDPKTHMIAGSVGQGNWATVPWVCIFDRNITKSATKGVYIVYLLAKDGNTLYLTFNQGCTEIRNKNSKSDTIKIMRQKAAEIVAKIDSRGFSTDERIDLGSGLTGLGELYQKGTIFYKAYKKGNIPSNDELLNDLNNMMANTSIAVKEEGVSEPKYTNMFLLTHCTHSYELFNVRSEEQFRLLHELKRMFDHTEMNAKGNDPMYRIDDKHSILVHEGCFDILSENGEQLFDPPLRVSDFSRHPRYYFNLIAERLK